MKARLCGIVCLWLCLACPTIHAEGNMLQGRVDVDLSDRVAVLRGARYFVNYCLSCHALSAVRYNQFERLGLTPAQIRENLIFTGRKIGDTMQVAMRQDDAKRWFGAAPPDLSVIARARGVDWLYAYLTTFYLDAERPTGVNNLAFPNVAMPDVVWQVQGLQMPVRSEGSAADAGDAMQADHLNLVQAGTMTPVEYEHMARDVVAFLSYVGEPRQLERRRLGIYVLAFIALLFVVSYSLKKEYWKDVRH